MTNKLDERLKLGLQQIMLQEKEGFYEETNRLFEQVLKHDIRNTWLYGKLSYNYPRMFCEEYARNIITVSFADDMNPIVGRNSLKFKVLGSEEFFDPSTNEKFNELYDSMLERSVKNFFSQPSIIETYNQIPEFDEFLYVKNKKEINIEGWIKLFNHLISISYTNFAFNKVISTNQVLRFSKRINDQFSIALEYDVKELKFQMRTGNLCFPEVFLVVFSNQFDKSIKYERLDSNVIWRLCQIDNPFFRLQSSLAGYFARMEFKGVKYCQPKEFAFYEFFNQASFNYSFIRYIESSFTRAISN